MVHNLNLFPKGTGQNLLPLGSSAESKIFQTNIERDRIYALGATQGQKKPIGEPT